MKNWNLNLSGLVHLQFPRLLDSIIVSCLSYLMPFIVRMPVLCCIDSIFTLSNWNLTKNLGNSVYNPLLLHFSGFCFILGNTKVQNKSITENHNLQNHPRPLQCCKFMSIYICIILASGYFCVDSTLDVDRLEFSSSVMKNIDAGSDREAANTRQGHPG